MIRHVQIWKVRIKSWGGVKMGIAWGAWFDVCCVCLGASLVTSRVQGNPCSSFKVRVQGN